MEESNQCIKCRSYDGHFHLGHVLVWFTRGRLAHCDVQLDGLLVEEVFQLGVQQGLSAFLLVLVHGLPVHGLAVTGGDVEALDLVLVAQLLQQVAQTAGFEAPVLPDGELCAADLVLEGRAGLGYLDERNCQVDESVAPVGAVDCEFDDFYGLERSHNAGSGAEGGHDLAGFELGIDPGALVESVVLAAEVAHRVNEVDVAVRVFIFLELFRSDFELEQLGGHFHLLTESLFKLGWHFDLSLCLFLLLLLCLLHFLLELLRSLLVGHEVLHLHLERNFDDLVLALFLPEILRIRDSIYLCQQDGVRRDEDSMILVLCIYLWYLC